MWYTFAQEQHQYKSTYIPEDGDDSDNFKDEVPDYNDLGQQAHQIAQNSGIHIYRNRHLERTIQGTDGKVAAALWVSYDDNEFTFDVVVDPKHRQRGLAQNLVNAAINEYRELSRDFPAMKLYAQVVSPEMQQLLSRHFGWHVIRNSGGTLLMGPE